MDHVKWSKHRGLGHLGTFWDIFSPRNHVVALLSSLSQLIVDAFPSGKAAGSLRGGSLLEESLPIITFRAVGILESEPTLSSSLSPEEDEDKALGEEFLEAEEAKTLLKERLAMQRVWGLPFE